MPCSCGGMRRSGLAPSNVAIRQNQPTQNIQRYYSPPSQVQIQRPTQPKQEQSKPLPQPQPQAQAQTQQPVQFQSNRPNFSANLPRRR
jgi:hypothetical protein